MKDRRDEAKKEFPELTVIEITKKLADEWNSMSDEKKKPYMDAAELDKERYFAVCIRRLFEKLSLYFGHRFKAETEEYNKKNVSRIITLKKSHESHTYMLLSEINWNCGEEDAKIKEGCQGRLL